jgi:hypothetical protein
LTLANVRRHALSLVVFVAIATPYLADVAAQPRIFRLGHLSAAGRTPDGGPPMPLREGLRSLGYVEGKNIVYEARFADGSPDRLPAFAAELVRLRVDAIVAQGGRSVLAAQQATRTIPIVTAPAAGDNVALGVIASLARPGGNITGLTDELPQLSAKRMELLKEAVPNAAVIAVVWNADDQGMTLTCRPSPSGHRKTSPPRSPPWPSAVPTPCSSWPMRSPPRIASASSSSRRRTAFPPCMSSTRSCATVG